MKKSVISTLLFLCILNAKSQTINPVNPIDKGIDVGVYSIPVPILDSTIAWTLDSVKIIIKNYGSTIVTSIPVSYSINGMVISGEIWTGSLPPAATTLYQFAVKYMVPQGNYLLCAKTLLPGDAVATNDEICRNLYGIYAAGIESNIFSNWELFQNTPNPANNSTLIRFELPSAGNVSLDLRDLLGHVVFRNEKDCNAGTDQFEIDVNSIPSGFYLYSVNYHDMIRTRPMIIVK
jgi:hypothetical protein